MYSCILVPLDGSKLAEKALAHAEGLAKSSGATVHLIMSISRHYSGEAPIGGSLVADQSAARAAELDAKRRLAERVYGLTIQSSTSVKDFVAQHDEIRSHMDAVLIGAVVEHTTFDGEVAEVTVSIPGIRVWEIVHQRIRIVRR